MTDYLNTSNFKGFRYMHNGPSVIKLPKCEVALRSRTGEKENWKPITEDSVSLDLAQHEYGVDGYVFSVLDMTQELQHILGWIFFDELLEKGKSFLVDGTVILTITIGQLRDVRSLKQLTHQNKHK